MKHLKLTINGEVRELGGGALPQPARRAAQRGRPHRHQEGLRRRRLRRLHRDPRRQAGQFLPGAGVEAHGRDRAPSRACSRRRQLHPLQESFMQRGARAVRLLHAGHDHDGEGAARREPASHRGQIRFAIAGNICRCTGYTKIIEAIRAARRNGEISIIGDQRQARRTCWARSPARRATRATLRCRACCTPRSSAATSRTPASAASNAAKRWRCPA